MERLDKILKDSLLKRINFRSLDCPTAVTLSEYLDGELKPDAKERVESHLANCLFCQETLVLARKAIDYWN